MGTLKLWIPLLVLSIVLVDHQARGTVPKFLKNKYGTNSASPSPTDSTASKTYYSKSKTTTTSKTKNVNPTMHKSMAMKNGSSSSSGFQGGCASMPSPQNAKTRCSQYSGCRADCMPNYQFPNGKPNLKLICEDGQWVEANKAFTSVPNCEPICLPECQNNGICLSPNQCSCPENFSGPQCQFEKKPCLNHPPIPMNSKRSCNSKKCTVTCMNGHEFPDGSGIATMECKNGLWVPTKETWVSIPDCQATCDPPCQNGGNCLSFNVCQCPQDFRGPQCQYTSDVCAPKLLEFNGGYNCSGDAETFSCSINCPPGISFDFPPEEVYTCTYSLGMFLPMPVPKCLYPEGSEVSFVDGGTHSSSYVNETVYNSSSSSTSQSSHSQGGGRSSYSQGRGGSSHSQGGGGSSYSQGGGGSSHSQGGGGSSYSQGGGGSSYSQGGGRSSYEKNSHGEMTSGNGGGESVRNEKEMIIVEQKLPKPGTCFSWGGNHYKTFDNRVYSFNSMCPHILVRDSQDGTFSIITQNHEICQIDPAKCHKSISIYMQNIHYVLDRTPDGSFSFKAGNKNLPIPGRVPGVRVEMMAHNLLLSLDTIGVQLLWDGKLLLQISVKENLWNRTEGLCGVLDGDISNDLMTQEGNKPKNIITLATSWQVSTLDKRCNSEPTEDSVCTINPEKVENAGKFCNKLVTDNRFKLCQNIMDIGSLHEACMSDFCNCPASDPTDCACVTFDVYVKHCAHFGITGLTNWRDDKTCPMRCTNGKLYKSCGSTARQPACGSIAEGVFTSENNCVEGCFCPEGTVLHEDKCITKNQCPCMLRGKSFPASASVPKDCNTCTCSDGQWICTQVDCGARCSAIGDPHYATFDGRKYDFMGKCSYYLVKNDNFSIEAENTPCAGAISEAMHFPAILSGIPTCTKTVTIRINDQTIKLKQNHELVVNGQDINKVPFNIAGIKIKKVSSIFMLVTLPNGITVWWDGNTRVYIDLPAKFKDATRGLCGSFNNNQADDFLTPQDDIEQAVIPFANKWKTSESCPDLPEVIPTHPCDKNLHKRPEAEEYCAKIKQDLFKDCHFFVDPDQFYKDCLFDMCSCEFQVSKCLCPIIASYATECSRQGIHVDFRNEIRECGVHCPGGQKYQICGNPCTRSCTSIQDDPDCKPQCIEGCNCPEGQTMDENGECISIGQCKCSYRGLDFPPGYKEIRPATKAPELCTCSNAVWECYEASDEDKKMYPSADMVQNKCNASANMEFTTCEPVEPVTCKNMHSPELYTPAICHAGCQCKEGYVLDTQSRTCVKPTQCPCHHANKSYKENDVVQSGCNTCTCTNGKWACTDRQCAAECSAWGDSHYKTFDGKRYDYQGECDYVLSKGGLGSDSFHVSVQNVPCGSLGTACFKSVTIKVTSGDGTDIITLEKDKPIPALKTFKHITVREKSRFVIVEAPELGLVVHWDRGTRVYVRLHPKWKGKTIGLCGNYNNNEMDDFQTPSGGLAEVSPNIFGDSWRLQPYCTEAMEIKDTCESRPDRKIWAVKKCGILKSSVFAPCHYEVPVEYYFDKCTFDTCACDQGGDCECLCTALAAYAQECNNRGVAIKWRTPEFCPMQCDETCTTYSPCISTCPEETCDNLLMNKKYSKTCGEDVCIEGCAPKPCPPGHVYTNSTHKECVPIKECRPVCMVLDDVTYYEGDLMEEDDCHSCYCSREEKKCRGEPCPTTVLPPTTLQNEQIVQCETGWTKWINQDKPAAKEELKDKETEPVPSSLVMLNLKDSAKCSPDMISSIECRTVKDHLTPKETGLDVECSLEKGLICKSPRNKKTCPDFEIRVKCNCGTRTVLPETTPEPIFVTKAPTCILDERKVDTKDCSIFYICAPGMKENQWVKQDCGPGTYYNPISKVCDWPYQVEQVRPECKKEVTTQPTAECPSGMVMDNCAIQCDNLCLYYDHIIKKKGFCKGNIKCEPGCVLADKPKACPKGQKWSNEKTCVDIENCMCVSEEGKPLKPGKVYDEPGCKKCQCIDNSYSCQSGSCSTKTASSATEGSEEETRGSTKTGARHSTKVGTTGTTRKVQSHSTARTTVTTSTETSPTEETEVTQSAATTIPTVTTEREIPLTSSTTKEIIPTRRPPEITETETESAFTTTPRTERGTTLTFSTAKEIIPSRRHPEITGTETESAASTTTPTLSTETETSMISHNEEIIGRKETLLPEFTSEVTYASTTTESTTSGTEGTERITSETESETTRTTVPRTTSFVTGLEEETVGTTTTEEGEVVEEKYTNKKVGTQQQAKGTASYRGQTTYAVPSAAPPPECSEDRFSPLIQGQSPLPDEAFTASSVKEDIFAPKYARINSEVSEESGGSWAPKFQNQDQYLEINLGKPTPVYGVIIKGSPLYDEYVTSYRVSYSTNGKTFYYILDKKKQPIVFKGSSDATSEVKQYFPVPIDAKIVRINPKTWNNGISMQAEIIGCSETKTKVTEAFTTRAKATTTKEPQIRCDDPMGLDDRSLPLTQVTVSSSKSPDHRKDQLRLSATSAWQPAKNSPTEWIMFDFLEPGEITGIETTGGPDGWVQSYIVQYSNNNKSWKTIKHGKEDKIFVGNADSDTPQVNLFAKQRVTRYLKIVPKKWKNNIQMRVEVLGCFKPYPTTKTTEAQPTEVEDEFGTKKVSTVEQGTTRKSGARPTEVEEKFGTKKVPTVEQGKPVTQKPLTTYQVPDVTPAPECVGENYIPLVQGDSPLPDDAFKASSVKEDIFAPKNSRFNVEPSEESGGSWAPKDQDENQWLEINLEKPQPVYGVIVKGSPLYDEYVTSYRVLFSTDGKTFYYVLDKKKKQPIIFRGDTDSTTEVKQYFDEPIEAKSIRINPKTWNNGISLQVELIGCAESLESTTYPTTTTTTKKIKTAASEDEEESKTKGTSATKVLSEEGEEMEAKNKGKTSTKVLSEEDEDDEERGMNKNFTTTSQASGTAGMKKPTTYAMPSVTPPGECLEDRFTPLIQGDSPLPDEAFTASSVKEDIFAPHNARFNTEVSEESGGSWAPKEQKPNQYLEINLGKQEPVYGVIVKGSPLYDEYVTSYRVMYSPDGHTFYYILDKKKKKPILFRGSTDSTTEVKQYFDEPIEAKIVRINPRSWNNGISLQVELIGCAETTTTTEIFKSTTSIVISTTQSPMLCDDPMGLEDGSLALSQVSVSSAISPEHGKGHLKLSDKFAWQPMTNSPSEWIVVDFLEPRDITGIVTKGGPDGWVENYIIQYSNDNKAWSTIMYDKKDKIFAGNFNSNMPQVNNFELPIRAQYVKIVPKKWRDNIQMRLEIHGCYEPYPTQTTEYVTTTISSKIVEQCNFCPGIKETSIEKDVCRCISDLWWDGENCVNRTECPCLVGYMQYPIGSVFEEEDCSECVCKIGGVPVCTPKKCAPCQKGLWSTVTTTCACTCKPCPEGTTLCPTSNICINSTLWCNGIQDCPDDEADCVTTAPTPVPTTTRKPVTKEPVKCVEVVCGEGYNKVLKKKKQGRGGNRYMSQMIRNGNTKTAGTKTKYVAAKGGRSNSRPEPKKWALSAPAPRKAPAKTQAAGDECIEAVCVPKFPEHLTSKEAIDYCPPVECQDGYIVVLEEATNDESKCQEFTCNPPPKPDAVCNVIGRTFKTFDSVEYKYDICDHVLARDLEYDSWEISLRKSCRKVCSRDLVIQHDSQKFVFHPDFTVEYDGYTYTLDQIIKIAERQKDFSITLVGNTVLFTSQKFGFWVIWDHNADVKIGVDQQLKEKVDGLCGYFDGEQEGDKRKPDGSPSKTTVDFGDSWALSHDQPQICEAKACPIAMQNKAWEICNKVKEQSLGKCGNVVNVEAFISRCLETTCTCFENAVNDTNAQEKCKCQALQPFVGECLSANPNIDIANWRMEQNCPAPCSAPLIYNDCYQRRCEQDCKTFSDPDACPKINDMCFPGCYCPAGYVREGNNCIQPSSCRNCECNLLPHLTYITYDENNFTVSGNCVYVMSRDVITKDNKEHQFQVLVTNDPCPQSGSKTKTKSNSGDSKMCVGKITILYDKHKIHVLKDTRRFSLKIVFDGERVEDFADVANVMKVQESQRRDLNILLKRIQVVIKVSYPNMGVTVQVPSYTFGGKLEGICGDCNGKPENDFKKPDGKSPKDELDFGLSWLYEDLPGGQSREQCVEQKKEEKCKLKPDQVDPCVQLLDENKFGQCSNIIDPNMYVEWCRKDVCSGDPSDSCESLEAYAKECSLCGFCVNWRNDLCPAPSCPPGQLYSPCGPAVRETCDSLASTKNPTKGKPKNIPTEGCFCPKDKVLLNETCIEPRECTTCDNEGHHPGDEWKKDKCTTCRCDNTNLACDTQKCTDPAGLCERGYNAVKVPTSEEECCVKYACVIEPTSAPTCDPPQHLLCAKDQILKLDTKPNGCQVYICECKQKQDCDKIDLPSIKTEPGYIKEIDSKSGCCPKVNFICKKETCPPPIECPQYYTLKSDQQDGKCCPIYSCKAPEKCIVLSEHGAASEGGERPLTDLEKQKMLKSANESWKDGPCRTCKCTVSETGNFVSSCSKTVCPNSEKESDGEDYELVPEKIYNECCPTFKREACKYNGRTYKVGETWHKDKDYCTSMKCVRSSSGSVQKETQVKHCNPSCDAGFAYVPPTEESKDCCGVCKQVACMFEGKPYPIGEKWTSPDFCTKYVCTEAEGSVLVKILTTKCAKIPEENEKNFVVELIPEEGKCCPKQVTTACKVDGNIVKIGETWSPPDDKCKTYKCIDKGDKDLNIQQVVHTCKTNCGKGWTYQKSDKSCCGTCVQQSCVLENEVWKEGETWKSPDKCTTFTCEKLGDHYSIVTQQETCPPIDGCPTENIYTNGCCQFCNATAEALTKCLPVPIPLEETIGMVTVKECRNKYPIANFTECVGSCESATSFNIGSAIHESTCACCQALAYNSLLVELECNNGSKMEKKIAVPTKCGCNFRECEGAIKTSFARPHTTPAYATKRGKRVVTFN